MDSRIPYLIGAVIWALLFAWSVWLCGCGSESPDYYAYGLRVYLDDGVGPSQAEMEEAIDCFAHRARMLVYRTHEDIVATIGKHDLHWTDRPVTGYNGYDGWTWDCEWRHGWERTQFWHDLAHLARFRLTVDWPDYEHRDRAYWLRARRIVTECRAELAR